MSIAKKLINYLESMSRYCHFYKTKDGNWYMELASEEYGNRHKATTYGPFPSQESAYEYLNNFSNPGGFSVDKSGKAPVPKNSPDGRPVEAPRSSSNFYMGYRRG